MNRKAGAQFTVGEITGEPRYARSAAGSSVALPASVLPGGQKGLDSLVQQQSQRIATPAEVDRWIKGGANARAFIVPAGAALPGGPPGHNTFLRMDGYRCEGVGCP
jgi:hypothetical protein